MLKKILFPILAIFLSVSLINISIGILFWLKNINRKPLENFSDAPYVYYRGENRGNLTGGFDIDPSIKYDKDTTEIRVLMLGGSVANNLMRLSFTGQNMLSEGENKYLENLIQKSTPGHKIAMLNGALPAYVSQQEFIALQMHLQYYQPDIVVGLHGFNDIESFRVNHQADDPEYIPSPLFYSGSWNSPLFKIVEAHKKKYDASEIFEGYYHHIAKAYKFGGHQLGLAKNSNKSINDITVEKRRAYVLAHTNIVKDLDDFCRSKGFIYINFLQPARFYHSMDSLFYDRQKTPISNSLSKIFFDIENELKPLPYHFSLTNLDHSKLNFTDVCHPDLNGYKYLADVIAPYIVNQILTKKSQPGTQTQEQTHH